MTCIRVKIWYTIAMLKGIDMKKFAVELLSAAVIACLFFGPLFYYMLFMMKP